jgi:hypothetical protein
MRVQGSAAQATPPKSFLTAYGAYIVTKYLTTAQLSFYAQHHARAAPISCLQYSCNPIPKQSQFIKLVEGVSKGWGGRCIDRRVARDT